MDFYDRIAKEYDEITSAQQRGPAADAFVKRLLARRPVGSAVDVACGTGMYTLPLAKAGLRVVGSDLSQAMLDQAARTAQAEGLNVRWVCSPMQELADRLSETFDAVLCMGNSIPHLLANEELSAAMEGFVRVLNPGGIVVLQLLNYARVLEGQERIVGIDRLGGRQYVRFYDFLGDLVRFNILSITWQGDSESHELNQTTLRPYRVEELRAALRAAGCKDVETFGGLAFEPFDARQSATVMLVGTK